MLRTTLLRNNDLNTAQYRGHYSAVAFFFTFQLSLHHPLLIRMSSSLYVCRNQDGH